jgi:hypothetical protein
LRPATDCLWGACNGANPTPGRVADGDGMNYSKYSAIRTEVDGILFASKREARRYVDLKVLEQGGLIKNLELQPKFPLVVNGKHIAFYQADFKYVEDGETIIEDVKGVRTPTYRMKKKLMSALWGIEIRET